VRFPAIRIPSFGPSLRTALEAFLTRLTRRERIVLGLGGVALLGFVLGGLASLAERYQERMKSLERLVQQKQQDRATLVRLREDYVGIRQQVRELEERIDRDRGSFSLLSFMETLADRQAVRSSITSMRPQPASELDDYRELGVEIKMENVTLEQVVRFLSSIETSPHLIRVKRMRMRTRFANPQFMDVTFLATTYEPSRPE
jgi:Tfp pilus assembly protein PilO